eukprot:CAMPEP_0113939918 /NCGR_PEP_ID=MMETSP1339-20121228/6140_1 /TAXON_ID=94617 /ORGANISM="Fibrocapsa japonica" /LENGTH=442 /DNA_ID=CAMNT_0000943563 /DNA_START=83 /DNA_END=1408 /DNA_ORIENTATION=- /assembly_acc=CAM_ASM_000762
MKAPPHSRYIILCLAIYFFLSGIVAVPNNCNVDSDNDGVVDCDDQCPADPSKTEPGLCGCGMSDKDYDNDGTPLCLDNCPDDNSKTEPGQCGCGIADTDTDGDGAADCNASANKIHLNNVKNEMVEHMKMKEEGNNGMHTALRGNGGIRQLASNFIQDDPVKYIIIHMTRVGSTWQGGMIQKLPNVFMGGEFIHTFKYKEFEPWDFVHGVKDIPAATSEDLKEYLGAFYSCNVSTFIPKDAAKVDICKSAKFRGGKGNPLNSRWPDAYFKWLRDNGVLVLHLVRANPFRRCFSCDVAHDSVGKEANKEMHEGLRNSSHPGNKNETLIELRVRISINTSKLIECIDETVREVNTVLRKLEEHQLPYLQIVYEDMIGPMQHDLWKQVLLFLGQPFDLGMPTSTPRRQEHLLYEKETVNYPEVRDALTEIGYEWMLLADRAPAGW